MDWVMGMQRAIDYVEAHITEDLDYNEIARQSCSTAYHFQRMFGLLCGYTLGEYIRNRRLTLAGGELASGDVKVIDTALKYGYDNPDSFARAFTRFHGITPSQARREGAKLNSFSRLSLKLSFALGHFVPNLMGIAIPTAKGHVGRQRAVPHSHTGKGGCNETHCKIHLKLVADLTANSVSSSQIESISGYLQNWDEISFDDKRRMWMR